MASAQRKGEERRNFKVKYEALLALKKGTSNKGVAERFVLQHGIRTSIRLCKLVVVTMWQNSVKLETYKLINNALLNCEK